MLPYGRRHPCRGHPRPTARHSEFHAGWPTRCLWSMTKRSPDDVVRASCLTLSFRISRIPSRAADPERRNLLVSGLHPVPARAYFPRERCWRGLPRMGRNRLSPAFGLVARICGVSPPGTHTPTRNRGTHHAPTSNFSLARPRGRPSLLRLLPSPLWLAASRLLRSGLLPDDLLPSRRRVDGPGSPRIQRAAPRYVAHHAARADARGAISL